MASIEASDAAFYAHPILSDATLVLCNIDEDGVGSNPDDPSSDCVRIPVSRMILARESTYFLALFTTGMRESLQQEVVQSRPKYAPRRI